MNVSEVKSNKSHNYVYSLIEFNCELIIDYRLLGKCVAINKQKDSSFCICFPQLILNPENGIYKLRSSLPFDASNLDTDNWGRLLSYSTDKDGNITDMYVAISSVWIVTTCSIIDDIKELKTQCEWFLRCAQAMHPGCVIFNGKDTSKLISQHSYSYFNTTGRPQCSMGEISITLYHDYTYRLNIKHIQMILRNFGKNVVLPYELLLGAYQELAENNFRNTILNCAMTLETAFKSIIRKTLNSLGIDESIVQYMIKNTDGLNKIEQIMKLLSITPRHQSSALRNNVFDLRNKIIHGGLCPSRNDASKALALTQKTLKDYDLAYFDD